MRKKSNNANANLEEISKIIIVTFLTMVILSGLIYLFTKQEPVKEKITVAVIDQELAESTNEDPGITDEEKDENATQNNDPAPEREDYHSAKNSLELEPQQAYELKLLAENLQEPGGIATHPNFSYIYIAEEAGNKVSLIYENGDRVDAVSALTPIFQGDNENVVLEKEPIRQPEGLHLSHDGYLYVTEDFPGGRLIRYELASDGIAKHGRIIDVPGKWQHFAWEDINVGPRGEILLVGSDAESIKQGDNKDFFSGSLIYRDIDGNWWVPYERLFASFSSVDFTKNNRHAVYICEFTGELGWLDLKENQRLGGYSSKLLKTPEALSVMPDDSFIIGQEDGQLVNYDPAMDLFKPIDVQLGAVEAMHWDDRKEHLLISDDKNGKVYTLKSSIPYNSLDNRMDLASFESVISRLNIPEFCPEFLCKVLALGGMDYANTSSQPLPFRKFTNKVPLIAADAKAELRPVSEKTETDPIEQIQFIVFEPNKLDISTQGLVTALAGFYARKKSGDTIITTTKDMEARHVDLDKKKITSLGLSSVVAPHAATITVSPTGIASLQFIGLGITPDFSIVINPVEPEHSYMIVFNNDGTKAHYKLSLPPHAPGPENWVIAYADDDGSEENWKALKINSEIN